jgi:hypothetical protein
MKTAKEIISDYPSCFPDGLAGELMSVDDAVKAVDSVMPKWIPVSERFPNDRQYFDGYHPELGRITNLVCRDDQFIQDADCTTNAPCWRKISTLWTGITHWMPLPGLP